ncbi:hypothetical protein B566_EDAN003342 [Ephemera danica]|nr:hypothetical protein B566_EDAN003342 [Ephemera danica]
MHPALNIAVKAARRAGQIINRASNDLDLLKVTTKQPNDFVTEVDRAAELAIIETLQDAYPQHGILAEESGKTAGKGSHDAEFQWIIDPLDGTTNFIHGLPQYAVSIALARNGVLEQAVIFDPNRNELFTASKGAGAFLNERRIRVSRRTKLQEALIGTGFPYRIFDHVDAYIEIFKELTRRTAGQRRPGAASLDLAYVACGRYDGFWEFGLAPWDMAAGALLISEAGGLVSDLRGDGNYLASGNIVAGIHHALHGRLLEIEKLPPEVRMHVAVIATVDRARLFLQAALEIHESFHVVLKILPEHALHRTAVETNEPGKQFAGKKRHTTAFFFEDDLQENAAGQILTGFGIDDLECFELQHQILDVTQSNVGACVGIVETAVRVFLDQTNLFRHRAILGRYCVQRTIIAQ